MALRHRWRQRLHLRLQLWRARASSRKAGAAIVLHRLGIADGPRLDTPWPPAEFDLQARSLARHFQPVPVDELRAVALRRRRGQRIPVAMTFDDDLDSHRGAASICRRHGVPATFFLTGATLDGPSNFWWHRADRALDRGSAVDDLPRASAGATIAEYGGTVETLPAAERQAVAAQLLALAGPDPRSAGLEPADVQALDQGGLSVGFHTLEHHPLTTLDDADLAEALVLGREPIEALLGRQLDVIAYPHGDADRRVARAAAAAGFAVGFTTRSGAVHAGSDPLLEPRIDATRHPWPDLGIAIIRAVRAA